MPHDTARSLFSAYAGSMQKTNRAQTAWEYTEFELFMIPTEDRDKVFLGWLREGWELVGVHPKGKGQRKPLPVAILRRERAEVPLAN